MISHGKRWKYAFRTFFLLILHGRIADDGSVACQWVLMGLPERLCDAIETLTHSLTALRELRAYRDERRADWSGATTSVTGC